MLQIWLEPGLVHLKQSWPQALPTEKQTVNSGSASEGGFWCSVFCHRWSLQYTASLVAIQHGSGLYHAILRAVFWFFLSLNPFWFLFGSLLNLVLCQQKPEKSLPAMHPFQVIKVHNHRPGDIPRKVTVVGPWVKDNRWDSVVGASYSRTLQHVSH